MSGEPPRSPRLFRLARATAATPGPPPRAETPERCELCGAPLADEHRHLVDIRAAQLSCACRACAVLFDHHAAGGRQYRLAPERCRALADLELDEAGWAALGIPVAMAFFVRETAAAAVVARYPSPLGLTRSVLDAEVWRDVVAARNPIIETMLPDVEALLVHRARGARQHWIVPVDVCYALVGLLRRRWRGFSGGQEVWDEVAKFFDALREKGAVIWQDDPAASARTT